MKRAATLFTFALFTTFAAAQTAPDFTIVTTDGITRNLYSVLDSGKTIVLDFFYPTCQGCWYYAPDIEQCYQDNGAGSGNVQYWGINGGFLENDAAINSYRAQYGITNPCASGLQGNGAFVDSLYAATFGVFSYPTYAVVCPDRRIYWSVNYPPTVNGFNPYINDSCGTLGIAAPAVTSALSVFNGDAGTTIRFTGPQRVRTLTVFAVDGKCMEIIHAPQGDSFFPAGRFAQGVYVCVAALEDGSVLRAKFIAP